VDSQSLQEVQRCLIGLEGSPFVSLYTSNQRDNSARDEKQLGKMMILPLITNLIGEHVPALLITALQRATHKVLEPKDEVIGVIKLIKKIHRQYITKHKLDKTEQREISKDAARRLVSFLPYLEHLPARATRVLLQALCLNWRVVASSEIKNLIRSLMRRIMRIWTNPKLIFSFL